MELMLREQEKEKVRTSDAYLEKLNDTARNNKSKGLHHHSSSENGTWKYISVRQGGKSSSLFIVRLSASHNGKGSGAATDIDTLGKLQTSVSLSERCRILFGKKCLESSLN